MRACSGARVLACSRAGLFHFIAFTIDAFSHLPGGKRLAAWLLSRYLGVMRAVLRVLGIKLEVPVFLKSFLGGKEDAALP